MEPKSKINIAYDILKVSNQPMSFIELWNKIIQIKGINPQEASSSISSFYTALTMDGRFVNIGNNTWDLRENHKFSEVEASLKDFDDSSDDSDSSEEEELDEESEEKEIEEDEESEENF